LVPEEGILMRKRLPLFGALAVLATAAVALQPAVAGAGAFRPAALSGPTPIPAFTNTPLISTLPIPGVTTAPNVNSTGNSEPELAFSNDGAMAVDGLAWLPFQLNVWTGHFGSTPSYFGAVDANLQNVGAGRARLGSEDTDVKFTSAGTMLLVDLDLIVPRAGRGFQLGVNVTRCPAEATGPSGCSTAFLDIAGADRPWITTAGTDAWVSYHDAGNSALIRVKRSTDDGRTWVAAASPIVGQGTGTAGATFNNIAGPIVADPGTGTVYAVYATGETQQKSKTVGFNNIFVSRSTDGAKHWAATLVFHAPPGTGLGNIFPALAVDPVTHVLYAAWTDQHGVSVSQSGDGGLTWSAPVTVSTIQTTVMPWVAARNGKVDVVYYGSTAASPSDPSAVWNVYDSQFSGGAWTVKQVSNTPNRMGAICLAGSACPNNTNRELLDLFQVAEDPLTGKAAIIYTDSTIDTWTSNGVTHELPEIVLAFEQ
jgi:hypothetical protein